jgi:hypothetical protein
MKWFGYWKRTPSRRVKDFEGVCRAGVELFIVKNSIYGDSIAYTGVLGACVEIVAKTARLISLVLRDVRHGRSHRDEIRDTLLDLHNYAAIGMLMLKEDNWEGQGLPKTQQGG